MVTWDATNITNNSRCVPSKFTLDFSLCHTFPFYFTATSLSIHVLLGFPANCYVLWLSLKEMIQGQVTDIFAFNAALVEVVFCSSFIFVIQQYFFHCVTCRFGIYFPGLLLLVGRPLFLTCICVERYVAVLHPFMFLKFKPMKYRIILSVSGWILVIVSSLIVSVNIIELHSLVLPELLFFFSVKLFSCFMVLRALKRPGPGENINRTEGINQEKLKAFRIIRLVLVSSVIMYGPMTISLVLYYVLDLERFLLSWSTALCLGLISGFVQPFLYVKRVRKLPFC